MAITPLGADEYGFTYNGESSKTYGVYISDGAFYSAPMRDTTRVEIPGRNGAFLQDHGRFKNIQVVYRCTLYTEAETDFISGMADVRAWLCSVKGYAKLTDDFNPNEYRKAAFVDGIGVSNIRPEVGTFDITFDAMPQRFLTSGETKTTIASSGDTITNPTKFPSRPLLEVNGYGAIGINGNEVEIRDGALGEVLLLSGGSVSKGENYVQYWYVYPNYGALNTGDPVVLKMGATYFSATIPGQITSVSNFTQSGSEFASPSGQWNSASFSLVSGFTFNYGTGKTSWAQADFNYTDKDGNPQTMRLRAQIKVYADGHFQMMIMTPGNIRPTGFKFSISDVYGDSSQSVYGNPLYLDLDIGEAYKIENDEFVSVNPGVYLGAELPELEPGANTITFDNTVTTLKIVPRWWTV